MCLLAPAHGLSPVRHAIGLQGAAINKSLLTLGTVINKLSEGVQAAGAGGGTIVSAAGSSCGAQAMTLCCLTPQVCHRLLTC